MGMTAQAARITLCGGLTVEIAGRRVEAALPGRKGRLLFAQLVVERGRPVARDALIDAIWEEHAPVDPDAAFSTLLTRLRSALGAATIQGRGELTLVLGEDAWVDWEVAQERVNAAEQRLGANDNAAALEAALSGLQIAGQTLLPELRTSWIEARRRQLGELHAALLEAAGRSALRIGGEHLAAAERHAGELIAREPYRESAHGLLMEIHAARGNVAEALRVYDELRRLLRDKLGLTPSPPITELATRLLAEPAPEAPPERTDEPRAARSGPESSRSPRPALPAGLMASASQPLAGRRGELRELLATGVTVRDACSRSVLISGEAGVGKTRLAAELAVRACAEGFEILHGGADRHGVTPYQPFVEALRRSLAERPDVGEQVPASLRPELAELAELVPELRAALPAPGHTPEVDAELRRHRVFSAVSAVLSVLMRDRPLLLVIDDLQWAARDTLLLLRHVIRAAASERLLVIATIRNDEALSAERRALVLDLVREGRCSRLALNGLTLEEASTLVDRKPAVRRLWAETAGNPSLLRALAESGEADGIPADVQDEIDCRMLELSAGARHVLTVAAAEARSLEVPALAAQADTAEDVVAEALTDALRLGLIVHDPATPGRFGFRHAIARRAVVAAAVSDPRSGRTSAVGDQADARAA
jgi:DNA-binding SARP family transcriptional activator